MGTTLKYTVALIMPFFKHEAIGVAQLQKRTDLTESTARRLIQKAVADGLLERVEGKTTYAIPDPTVRRAPRAVQPAVVELPVDSGLMRLRKLAAAGALNPYVQLEWAGEARP